MKMKLKLDVDVTASFIFKPGCSKYLLTIEPYLDMATFSQTAIIIFFNTHCLLQIT